MNRTGAWFASLAVFLLSLHAEAQPLGANPSAAPSDIGNSSSVNPAARPSDIRNPSATNPSAGASQITQPRVATPSRPAQVSPRVARQRIARPPTRVRSVQRSRRVTAKQVERRERATRNRGRPQR